MNIFNKNLLYFVCLGGNCDMVEMFFNYGFDVDERSSLGWILLMYVLVFDLWDYDERFYDWIIKGLELVV